MVHSESLVKKCEVEYVSAGCNPVAQCMDWGSNGLLCYGSSNNIFLFKPEDEGGGKLVETIRHHKGRVNCVTWIRNGRNEPETEFISVSSDKSGQVWSLKNGVFVKKQSLDGHLDSVNTVASLQTDDCTIAVTSSADSTVKIWKRETDKFENIHTIEIQDKGFCFCAKVIVLSELLHPLIVLSTDEKCGKIMIYSIHPNLSLLTTLSGHEDWIRDMDFISTNGESFLATGSQDSTVRLWKFSPHKQHEENDRLSLKPILIDVDNFKIQIKLESILRGHEDHVCGLQWAPLETPDSELRLMTCSLDRTIMEWSPDPDSGVWLERFRLGEMGGDNLGFLGARYNPSCSSIIAYSHHSAFHRWTKKSENWKPDISPGGHSDVVSDIAWEPEGRYLLSASYDETARLHSRWAKTSAWHEMSRPQIHGYSINSIASLPNFMFVSAADEKVARVFQVPKNVLENLNNLSDLNLTKNQLNDSLPAGASVPALGLSNKAVYSVDTEDAEEQSFVPQILDEPPTEEVLVQNTLWPEIKKLYGHGNQVYSLASSHDGKLLASSCKASSKSDATIIIWDTETWEQLQVLEGHNLTVTRIEFSPDDKMIVSVSRDRTWCLFKKCDGKFKLEKTSPKGYHSRIIWDCSWTYDSKYFATCSRDGFICAWNDCGENKGKVAKSESVNSLNFSSIDFETTYLLASGSESGLISLSLFDPQKSNFTHFLNLEKIPALSITRVRFNPKLKNERSVLLAASSNDWSVRIYRIDFTDSITNLVQ